MSPPSQHNIHINSNNNSNYVSSSTLTGYQLISQYGRHLLLRYNNSLNQALLETFPEYNWDFSSIRPTSNSNNSISTSHSSITTSTFRNREEKTRLYRDNICAQREYIDWLVKAKYPGSYSTNNWSNTLYCITYSSFLLPSLFSLFLYSLESKRSYPELLVDTINHYLKSSSNTKNNNNNNNNSSTTSNTYSISDRYIDLSIISNLYPNNSLYNAIKILYPEYVFPRWEFYGEITGEYGIWTTNEGNIELQREYFEWIANQMKILKPEHWYTVTQSRLTER